ncbi:TPA: alpha/beta hydrolase [Pseudomonas aeruginosa]|uniref:alpha/beta hydrolase n=1 Tax=Pseudomonas aeruginosa TaxID=287 RepID=UPI001067E30C|nr:alpha/beta hydrolase [Pseudomonas aeruginosa]TEX42437.1 alpha/beta hydrolase [Pseudomonas aeruginosa]HBO1393550.1 alpha/beta hydrolase [Pseudomonas aeruginosa]HCD7913991.1 alpha/beta hydrolase [Pseudomonas aeruginosa]
MPYISTEAKKILALMSESGAPEFGAPPLSVARQVYAGLGSKLGGEVIEMASVEDLSMAGPGSTLPMRIYRPLENSGQNGALIYFHGGGWILGGIETHDRLCRQIAMRSSCVVISIGYRLAPEHPLPAAADDAIAAVRWVVDKADFLRISGALAVGGDSAGGGLAAYAALAARDEQLPVRAQVLIYPSVDNRESAHERYASRKTNAEVPPLTVQAMRNVAAYLAHEKALNEDIRLSPILGVQSRTSVPALILAAGADVLRDEGLRYGCELLDAGASVLIRNYPGAIHGFLEMPAALQVAQDAHELIGLFLRQQLIQKP